MTTEIAKMPRLPRKLQLILRKSRKSIALATQNDFRRVTNYVWMLRSATPAMQNDMTTCLETFEKDMFCSFPHRHGEAAKNEEQCDLPWKNVIYTGK